MQTICGVDVSKARLDAWIEQPAFIALWQAGCPSAIADPKAVRRFCQAMGALEKTDRIDAELIARFGVARRLKPMAPPSADQHKLDALGASLRQVTADLAVHKQRRHSTHDEEALASLDEAIAFLKTQAKPLSGRIAALIQVDPLSAALDQSLRSVKPVLSSAEGASPNSPASLPSPTTAASTPDNDTFAAAAPACARCSPHRRRRPQYDPDLAAFRQRLLDKGKPKMVVRTALARKLLVKLNAKARQTRSLLAHST